MKSRQIELFNNEDRPKLASVSSQMDKLNSKFYRGTINFAIQGTNNNWKPNTKSLSPRYTTQWDEIPKVII